MEDKQIPLGAQPLNPEEIPTSQPTADEQKEIDLDAWGYETMYRFQVLKNPEDLFRRALLFYSDGLLKIPYQSYKALCKHNEFSVRLVSDFGFQILAIATADQLGMSIWEYIEHKDKVFEEMGKLNDLINEKVVELKALSKVPELTYSVIEIDGKQTNALVDKETNKAYAFVNPSTPVIPLQEITDFTFIRFAGGMDF